MATGTKRTLKSGISRKRFKNGEIRQTVLNEIAPEAKAAFPYYFKLPYTDPIALLRWRIYVRKRCLTDLKFRVAIWEMCRRDVAFFAVTFLFIFEPRPLPRRLPFSLWTDQVSLLAWFTEIFGERDGAVNKTRGIGLSWLTAAFIFHKWLFIPECTIAVLTKDKDLLDSGHPNSMMGKFQYLFDNLPSWARYTEHGTPLLNRLIEKTSFINVGNAAIIQGFVSTSTKLRQLRFTMVFGDEFAFYDRTDQKEWMVSAGGVTNNRLLVSTWNDFDDEFHHIVYEEKTSLLVMEAFWWNNYERWQGAYKMEGGRVVLVDTAYPHEIDYKFGEPDLIDEGTIRSPWVDAEISKPGVDRLKALRDLYGMSVCERTNAFFDGAVRSAIKEMVTLPPDAQGTLDTTSEVKILPTFKSNLRTWCGVPNRDRGPYVLGNDLAHGVGAAFSTCSGLDRMGEQVLQYARNDLEITAYAYDVVQLARWLAGDNGDGWVLIDFEANGPLAKPFLAELVRLQYGNIHYSNVKGGNTGRAGEVSKYGGTINRDGGLANFRELERAIMAMETKPHDVLIANDMRLMGKDDDGMPKFPRGQACGHGDFIHGYGIAWWRARSFIDRENVISDETDSDYSRAIGHGADPWETNDRWSSGWHK